MFVKYLEDKKQKKQEPKKTNKPEKFQLTELERQFCKAVKRENFPHAKMLLNQGVNIDAIDSSGFTALHHACRDRSLKRVQFLYEPPLNML